MLLACWPGKGNPVLGAFALKFTWVRTTSTTENSELHRSLRLLLAGLYDALTETLQNQYYRKVNTDYLQSDREHNVRSVAVEQ